jgi:hypothetical protein
VCAVAAIALTTSSIPLRGRQTASQLRDSYYLGFDRNLYPGDANLKVLRRTFSYAGYWLNAPPGEGSNLWAGKRALLESLRFGFLILYRGKTEEWLQHQTDPAALGSADGRDAVQAARNREGFPQGAVIFLDVEEGGRLAPKQMTYLIAWADAVAAESYRAGVYCSGIPVRESGRSHINTAEDIHAHAGNKKISYWVYNDTCAPSPGCVFLANPPSPSASGIPWADVWQFAQSPRRPEFTAHCAATYGANGNCYAPGLVS